MSELFKKIMCPVDFDRGSGDALEFACRLAELHGFIVGRPQPDEDAAADDDLLVLPGRQLTKGGKRKQDALEAGDTPMAELDKAIADAQAAAK